VATDATGNCSTNDASIRSLLAELATAPSSDDRADCEQAISIDEALAENQDTDFFFVARESALDPRASMVNVGSAIAARVSRVTGCP
jgi:hypothetical protein